MSISPSFNARTKLIQGTDANTSERSRAFIFCNDLETFSHINYNE